MMEYSFPTANGTISSIAKPKVEANIFEIKPAIIQIIRSSVQFPERTDTRTIGVHSIDAISALSAQMAALTHTLNNSLQMGAAMWNGAPIRPFGACGQMGNLRQNCKMSSSAKFLKEVLSNKRKWEGGETVKLNEECSAILQNKLPPKLKDPGSFSIPCTIENNGFDKALCDLRASVNLMSYSIFEKLGMHELYFHNNHVATSG
ncbi:UNVERIFIED_CONTAM: hypothetical protein Scaly_1499400 [Sesamum calycinum]|uniref:Uncharacterized protein n=1 Tax=Sesamum calycinum TaxID=2727403 RepID=A0AAW2PSK8_9LAMI